MIVMSSLRCQYVFAASRMCRPQACVCALASYFSTFKFACHNTGGGLLAESGPVGLGRCLSTNLEVTKQ